MFGLKPPLPATFVARGFAVATALSIPAWWLVHGQERSSSILHQAGPAAEPEASTTTKKQLRTRSADGAIDKERQTSHEKLKLLILWLLQSPQTTSSVVALETLDNALVEMANDGDNDGDVVLDVSTWREDLRRLVVLAIQRSTQMAHFSTVSRLLAIYRDIPPPRLPLPGVDTNARVIDNARDLLRSKFSTQMKQLHVLLELCGKSAFVWLALGAGVGMVTGSVSQLMAHYFGMIQSAAFEGKLRAAVAAAAAAAAAQLICQLLEQISEECVALGGKTIRRTVQGQLFERLMCAKCSYHDHLPAGAKAALLKETSDLEQGLFEQPIQIFRSLGELLPMYSIISRMSWPLFFLSCVASPFLGWVSGRAAVRTAAVRCALTRLETSRSVTDSMVLGSHLKTIRANTDENNEIQRYGEYLQFQRTLERESLKSQLWSEAARFLKQCGRFGMLVCLTSMIRSGNLETTEFAGFFLQIDYAWISLETMYLNCGEFWKSFEPASRVLAALSLQGEVEEREEEREKKEEEEEKNEEKNTNSEAVGITFEDVHFSYPIRSSTPVLRGVSFTVRPGTATAIVGPSGSGKSTVLALLEGFYEQTSGHIYLGGDDVTGMNVYQRRRKISYVSQDATIFPRTIRDNVLMGGRHRVVNVSENDSGSVNGKIIQALKKANAWEFCERLPNGIHTWVVGGGESGRGSVSGAGFDEEEAESSSDTMGLSGGQRARIGIARAIFRQAPVLLLDEAFSNLDARSENAILSELREILVSERRTVIAISHQLESLSWVDQVVVMKDGKVVEVGTFDELCTKRGGHFCHMLRQKSGQKSE